MNLIVLRSAVTIPLDVNALQF